ncbi:MAG: hypothetical protein IT272_08730 [Chitinophagales bacterium]|nr:hypothetical protein [Sphingobacteriales bacterium]MBP9141982.1 hypothetical protein [Chitinophagales bacterium]MDA0198962.1 hypothetical protein [Bacteroidota bacterium]MBK6888915.1 hypothetical protein [Sphingobacteriales bacterium]MBL0246681.1 hypothetical protein [Sphingobacteriales bacterium]
MKFYYIFLLFLLNFKVVAQFDYSCTYNKVETDYDGYYSGRWVDRSDPFNEKLWDSGDAYSIEFQLHQNIVIDKVFHQQVIVAMGIWNDYGAYNGEWVSPVFTYSSQYSTANGILEDDNINLIGFDTFGHININNWGHKGAVTVVYANKCGESNLAPVITGVDILFSPTMNFQNLTQDIVDTTDVVDFTSVAVHELGHTFGLGHLDNIAHAVMSPGSFYVYGSIKKTLSPEDLCMAYVLQNSNIPCTDFKSPSNEEISGNGGGGGGTTCKAGVVSNYNAYFQRAMLNFEKEYLSNNVPKIKKTILHNFDDLQNVIYSENPSSKLLQKKLDHVLGEIYDNVHESFSKIAPTDKLNHNDIAAIYDFLNTLKTQTTNNEIISACNYIINYLPYLEDKSVKEALIILDKGEIPNNINYKDPITIVGLLNNYPNSKTVYLDYFLNIQGEFNYNILNQNAQVVKTFSEYQYAAKNSLPISIDKLPNGIYFIQVMHNKKPINNPPNYLRFIVSK